MAYSPFAVTLMNMARVDFHSEQSVSTQEKRFSNICESANHFGCEGHLER